MSRLEAALQRANAGIVAEPIPEVDAVDADYPYDADLDNDDLPPAGAEVNLVHHGAHADVPVDMDVEGSLAMDSDPNGDEPRFKEFNRSHAEKLIVSSTMPPSLREYYRRIGAMLHHAQSETGLKILMISSAVPEEGKTLTATNIALTLAESYQRNVLLIDADLRRPSLGDIFQVPQVFGLNEALTNPNERKVPIVQVSRHLALLPAGTPDPDPVSLLTSDRMRRLLSEASTAFEWVIVDTPPVGILTDAKLLGSMVDATLLVIRAGKTPAALVRRAVDALGRNRILGVVLNRAEVRDRSAGHYYYGAYYYKGAK